MAKCEGNDAEMERLSAIFIEEQKPHKFNPHESDNVLMAAEESFEEVCSTMEENGITDPKRLTEYEFYSKLRYFEKKFKARK